MAYRDILAEVSLQMENLKLSSPLRTEQNGDENKENTLANQEIPKIRSAETSSCTPTSPIFRPRDKTTSTQLNGTNINGINLNACDSPTSSSKELTKSLNLSEVENSIFSAAANSEENHDESTCCNGSLNETITKSAIELSHYINGASRECGNSTFVCEQIYSEDNLNSTFDVDAGVNVIVENVGNSEKQENLNSTFAVGENEYIEDTCNKEDYVNTKVGTELPISKKAEFTSTEDISYNLNLINKFDEKPENDKHSESTSYVSCAGEEKLSPGNESGQTQASLDSQIVNSVITSEGGDSQRDLLVITQNHINHLTCIEEKPSEQQGIDLNDSQCDNVKLDNYEDENFKLLKTEYSSPNHSTADIKEDTIVLNNSSVEVTATEALPNVSLQKNSVNSKEVLLNSSVSPQNERIEIKSCTSDSRLNLNGTEICNNLPLHSNYAESQLSEIGTYKNITLNTSTIPEVGINLIISPQSLQKVTDTENSNLLEHQQENEKVVPTLEFVIKKISCEAESTQDLDVLLLSQRETQHSVSNIEDLAPSSIDNLIENNRDNQVVNCSENVSETYAESPEIDINPYIQSNSFIPQIHLEGESNCREYLEVSDCNNSSAILPQEDSLRFEDDSLCSDDEVQPKDVTVVIKSPSPSIILNSSEPEKSKININQNIVCESPVGFESNCVSTVSCVEDEAGTCNIVALLENTVAGVSSSYNSIDLDVLVENNFVSTVEKIQEADIKQIHEKLVVDKLTNIPATVQQDVETMTEINKTLQQDISDLKLELNAAQQAKASLELEIGKKDEIILKTEAESIKIEQQFQQDIKSLKEQLKEKSSFNEKDSIKDLEEALKESKAKESQAVSELNARIVDESNYRKIMEEYEKTIAARIADYQKLKEENDTVTRHLANLELSFSDLFQKYERTKKIIDGFKNNEEKLKKSFAIFEDTFHKQEEKYESLKAHAKAQIEKSNKEIIKYKEKYDGEVNKLNAIIKRLEIKSAALETSLDQKSKECIALAALCDEVTGKKV